MKTIRGTFDLVVAGLAATVATMLAAAPGLAAGPTSIGVPKKYPVTITKSGSYVLTANLKLPNSSTKGIVIEISNVTIDFSGFTLSSPAGGALPGVDSTSTTGVVKVVIKNGIVTGFGADGIRLANNSSVQNMTVAGNGNNGITTGSGSLVTGCLANDNGGFGLNFTDTTSGYSNDIINANTGGTVNSGTSLGGNLCNGSATCP